MPERIASIVLLVEDLNQVNLVTRYLHCLGHLSRTIRVVPLPQGKGSGEQHVRQQYAAEVRAIRSQITRTKACLIAMIDADLESLDNRRAQLKRALEDADEPARSLNEPILILIPKRNVETWILCLNGQAVDEDSNYRHDRNVDKGSIKSAANTLFDWTRPNTETPETCVPSLQSCLPEFRRLPGDE